MQEADREKLQEVLSLLAQSPTGRALMEEGVRKGYRILLEDIQGGYGFADCVRTKTIVLNRNFPAEGMVLTLAHELAHVRQEEQAGITMHKGAYRLDEAVRVVFAQEADAFAHSVQVALELERKGIEKPYKELYRRSSFVSHVARLFVQEKPEMLDNGAIMAFAFETFYLHDPRRVKYAAGLVRTVINDVNRQEVETGKRHLALGRVFNAAVLKGKFLFNGKPYLDEHLPDMNLDEAHYSGVPARVKQVVNVLYERAEEATDADRKALADMPVYHADQSRISELIGSFHRRYGLGP